MTNRLLSRQLRRHLGVADDDELQQRLVDLGLYCETAPEALRNLVSGLGEFVSKVEDTYAQSERDLLLSQRSLEISSAELSGVNEQLRREARVREQTLRSLRDTTNRLLAPLGRRIQEDDGLQTITEHLDDLVSDLLRTRRDLEQSLKDIGDRQFALDQHAIVSISDSAGNITYANERFCQISGYAREELIGRNHRIVKSGAHSSAFYRKLWATISSGQVWHGEICNMSRDGGLYWVAATIVPIIGPAHVPIQYISIRTDISGQKDLEAQSQRDRQFLQSVMDMLGEGLYTLDDKGECTFVNPEAEAILGWSREEMQGCNIHDLIHFQRSDGTALPKESCPILHCMRDGRQYRSEDEFFTRKDGSIFPASVVSSPLIVEGKVVGSVATFQDITRRKRIEAEIVTAKETAEQANRAKSDFLATMSHEIRTPMNGIIGMTELALDTKLTADQREYLSLVKSSADSLLDIINDILDFSKIEAGHIDLERIPFRPSEMIRAALRPLGIRAMQKGVELVFEPDPAMPEVVVGDPGRLRQVLVNLVGNAIKFSDRGDVRIQAGVEHQAGSEVTLQFAVTDQGIGIPPEKLATIFDPFTQADTSTTRRFGGTGLGLAICSRLVKAMGGKISVDSRPGKGSTFQFFVSLGVNQGDTAGRPQNGEILGAVDPVESPGKRLHILLAEDNAVNQKLAMTLLARWGHDVVLANNGQEAVDRSARQKFDLILMDVQMPVLGGIEATQQIREREARTGVHTRIIAMTANAMTGDKETCIAAGMDDYLTKPLKQEALAAMLNKTPPDRESVPAIVAEPSVTFDYRAALDKADSWVIEVIADAFRSDWPLQVDAMRSAIATSDREVLQRSAHTLKGLLGNFNAEPAQALARSIELLAMQGEFAQAAPCVDELVANLALLDKALEDFASGSG